MMTRHAIRRATADDAGSISRLVHRAYSKWIPVVGHEPKPMKADYLRAVDDHEVWVLDGERGCVAVLELIPGPDHLLVENVAVEPALQGQGLGRRLMHFAETEAARRGLDEVRLFTNERFTDDLTFYDRLGYTEFDREPYGDSRLVFLAKRVGKHSPPP